MSVIAHPPGSRFLAVRPHYTEITGSGAAGAVLAVLEGWTNWQLQKASDDDDCPETWVRLTMKQLLADTCGLYGRRALEAGVDRLLELGLVERVEAGGTDRGYCWRLDVSAVNSAISTWIATWTNSVAQPAESPFLARASNSAVRESPRESTKNGRASALENDPRVTVVWEHWLERRKPRRLEITPSQAGLIAKGLKVAEVDELRLAIDSMLADPWYREHKELHLSSVLATKPGGPSLRDKIDRFLDKLEASPEAQATTRDRGVSEGRVSSLKADLRACWRSDDRSPEPTAEQLQRRDEAIRDLYGYGILVTLDELGKPSYEDIL